MQGKKIRKGREKNGSVHAFSKIFERMQTFEKKGSGDGKNEK